MASWFTPDGNSTTGTNKNRTQTPIVIHGKPVTSSPLLVPVSVYNNSTGPHYNEYRQQQQSTTLHKASIFGTNNNNNNNTIVAESMRQDKPQQGYRDVGWGILFYIHIIGIIVLTIIYSPTAFDSAISNYASDSGQRRQRRQLQEEDGEYNGNGSGENTTYSTSSINPTIILTIIGISGCIGLVLATVSLGCMISFAEPLVKMALFFNILTFGLLALLSLLSGSLLTAILFTVAFAVSICYTYSVWDRIPFAASNLVTAVSAVRANMGLTFYSYLSMLVVFIWSILWTISAGSTVFVISNCSNNGICDTDPNPIIMFLFFLSFYWTIQVILNVVHVTTAGTVGTWWFNPVEANGCCSSAVRDSYVRSLTTSFGSICFGSLLVAIIQAIKEMVHQMRQDGGDQLLLCLAECLIGCIESLIEYFNKWAFVYVGLYGFSFMEAGSNVMTMFRNRGWTTIITDSMVDTVLFMVAVGIGGISALCTVAVSSLLLLGSNNNSSTTNSLGVAAVLGFLIGYAMVSTMLSVVSSAVNTVIVLYAEAPNEFQMNHPELSNRMRESWRQAFPNEFTY